MPAVTTHVTLAAALAVLAVGCGTAAHHTPASSTAALTAPPCPGGEPRIQETNGGPWVCEPYQGVSPSPAAVDSQPPAAGPGATVNCTVGHLVSQWNSNSPGVFVAAGGPTPAASAGLHGVSVDKAVQITVTVPAGSDPVTVNSVDYAVYDAAGQELGSTEVGFGQTVTAGQSMSQSGEIDYGPLGSAADGAASCQVLSWG